MAPIQMKSDRFGRDRVFGAFLAHGITHRTRGRQRTTTSGKGSSLAVDVIVYPLRRRVASFQSEDNILIGNVCAVRSNQWAKRSSADVQPNGFASATVEPSAVVEGVGDHGCEYMTGGRVVILGKTGLEILQRACPAESHTSGIVDGDFASQLQPRRWSSSRIDRSRRGRIAEVARAHRSAQAPYS